MEFWLPWSCTDFVRIRCAHTLCTNAVKSWAQYSCHEQKTACLHSSPHPLALISFASFQWCSLSLVGLDDGQVDIDALFLVWHWLLLMANILISLKSLPWPLTFLWPWLRAGQEDRHHIHIQPADQQHDQSCGENNYIIEVRINWIFDFLLFSSSYETISFYELM